MPQKYKILLVEDDEFVSKAYRYFLMQAGYKVFMARNVREAREFMRKESPDIVLLDLIMPGCNGFEFLEELHDNGITEKIPIMIISNLGQEADIAECTRLGAADYLVKSNFFMKEIIEKVRFHLERKQSTAPVH